MVDVETCEPAKASFIKRTSYRRSDNRLTIVFSSGKSFDYLNVPEVIFGMFKNTDSFGTIYNSFVKGKYETVERTPDGE